MTSQARPTRDCTHPIANHQHGTVGAYRHDRCRCQPCTDANRRDHARYVYLADRDRSNKLVPADRARQHIARLHTAGLTYAAIAAAAGLSRTHLYLIATGATRQVTKRTEAAILRAHGITTMGARRRLQALARIGWDARQIAAESGLNPVTVFRVRAGVTAASTDTMAVIAETYERLHCMPRASWRTTDYASAQGWAPPLAWDNIDDPTAHPQGVRTVADDARGRRAERYEAVANMTAAGLAAHEIADRLGVTQRTVIRDRKRVAA